MKKMAFLVSIMILSALLFGCGGLDPAASSNSTPANSLKEAKPAPDFDLEKIAGGALKSADLKGKVVIVDFWATWCAPCIQEIPNYNALYEKWSGKGVELIGVTLESGALDDVKAEVIDLNMKYPVVMGDDDIGQGFGGLIGFPTTFVVSKDWKIHQKYLGLTQNKKEKLEKDIQTLLAQ